MSSYECSCTCLLVYIWTHFLEVELLDCWVCVCLAFQSSDTILFYIPISSYGNSSCFTSKEVIFNYGKKLGDHYYIYISVYLWGIVWQHSRRSKSMLFLIIITWWSLSVVLHTISEIWARLLSPLNLSFLISKMGWL